MKFLNLAAIGLLVAILNACGGGGDSDTPADNTPPPPPPLPAVQNGVFKDSNVSGIDFVSGAETGTTDENGRFTCETGMNVSFSVGNVVLGETECTTLVMPPSLVASGEVDDPETLNIARFLQMLDEDGSAIDGLPLDGIEISSSVKTLADSWTQVDFTTLDLDAELVSILSDVASTGTTATLPNATDAQQHLEDTMACAYAGAFAGSFTGTNSGAMEMKVGWSVFGVFQPRGAQWFGWDARAEQEGLFGGGFPVVQLAARPTIISDPTASGPINAAYVTPDRIVGTWEGGTFDVSRLGGDVGKYRFIGSFSGPVEEGIRSSGVIVIHLDGSSVTGEAFETTEGTYFQVTGSVSGDNIILTATGGGETINATAFITRDVDNEPVAATGSWPEGRLDFVSCRLN